MKKFSPAWVLLAGWVAGAVPAFAEDTKPPVDLSVDGLIDAYYSHNATNYNDNHPGAGNALNSLDFTDNSFALALAELDLTAKSGEAAGRLDLGFGPTADWLASLSNAGIPPPVFNSSDDTVNSIDKNILQAYVTYKKEDLTVDLGKFLTNFGLEVLDSSQDWNYSRSFLFTYAIPQYFTGLRANYTFDPSFSATGYVCDGWNNSQVDTFYDKSYGGQLTFKPTGNLTLTLNAIYGTYLPPLSRRLGEFTVTYQADDRLSFALDYAIGQDDSSMVGRPGNAWSDLALYARWQMVPDLAVAARGECYPDHDGATTGYVADLWEGTLTLIHPLTPRLLVKLEGRYDWAVNPQANYAAVNAFNGSPNQFTATLGAVFGF